MSLGPWPCKNSSFIKRNDAGMVTLTQKNEYESESVKDEDQELLEEAKENFEKCLEYYNPEYTRGREDLNFLMGDQWDETIRSKRVAEGRPCLTENRLLVFAHQVVNDIRQSRPAIQVQPVDNNSDVETAKVLKGIIRNIEVQSGADNVYDTSAWNSVSTGYGWIRVLTEYADDESFDKEIKVVRVPDFASVMLDPNSQELDGSDAEYGFVSVDIDEEKFEEMYPDIEKMDTKSKTFTDNGWCTEGKVRVVEYFYKEYEEKTLVKLADGTVLNKDDMPEGAEVVDERVVPIPKVKWCKFVGNAVLEKTEWEGKYIPIVPVYGEEVWQDGVRKVYSLVSQAKDPQKRYNYWLTAGTEIVALQPKSPYVGLVGQFKSTGSKWAKANNETFAYLEFDPVKMPDGSLYVNAPQRQSPPMGSPAMFQEMMAAADGIKSTLGIYDASLGAAGNETSGKAIIARQAQGNNATFHFVDNLQTSIRQVGRILVDLIPKIYSGQRIVRIIGEDESKNMVAINQAAVKKQNGDYLPLSGPQPMDAFFDLNNGKYDVVASVGPSYASKRIETANILQSVMQAAPDTFQLFGDIFFKNLDIAEADLMVERLRKANPMLRDEANPQEAQLQQAGQMIQGMQQQLAEMDAALKQKREKDSAETQAEIAKMQAETEKLRAEATKIQTEVAATMSQMGGVTPQQLEEIVRTIAALEATTQDTAEAVSQILSYAENQATGQPEQMPVSMTEGIPPNV